MTGLIQASGSPKIPHWLDNTSYTIAIKITANVAPTLVNFSVGRMSGWLQLQVLPEAARFSADLSPVHLCSVRDSFLIGVSKSINSNCDQQVDSLFVLSLCAAEFLQTTMNTYNYPLLHCCSCSMDISGMNTWCQCEHPSSIFSTHAIARFASLATWC